MRLTVHITPTEYDNTDILEFSNAGGWHIDDRGDLHIKGPMHGDGNIATIRHDVWRGVAKAKENPAIDSAEIRIRNVSEALADAQERRDATR